MFSLEKTETFNDWLTNLKDGKGRARILARLTSVEQGNFGDSAPVGDGISELRIHFGPGYRVYFKQTGKTIVLLLCGGDKSTQQKDINKAKEMAKAL
jgi:putative addiction module killer protein